MSITLPTVGDINLVLVVSFCLLAIGLSNFLSGWADRRFSWVGLIVTALALGMFVIVHRQSPLELTSVPEAFIDIIARLIR